MNFVFWGSELKYVLNAECVYFKNEKKSCKYSTWFTVVQQNFTVAHKNSAAPLFGLKSSNAILFLWVWLIAYLIERSHFTNACNLCLFNNL